MDIPQDKLKKLIVTNKTISGKNQKISDQIRWKVASVIVVDNKLIEDINWRIDLVLKWNDLNVFQLQLLWEIDNLKLNSFEYFPKIKECIIKILENLPFYDVKRPFNNNPLEKQLLDYVNLINKILTKDEIFNIFLEKIIKKSKFDDESLKEIWIIFKIFWFNELSFYKFKNICKVKKDELSEKDKYKILIKNINDLIDNILLKSAENWQKLELLWRFKTEVLPKNDINIYEYFPKIKECIIEILKTIPLSWVIYHKKFIKYNSKSHILRKEIEQVDYYIDIIKQFLQEDEIIKILNSRIIQIDWKKWIYFNNFLVWQNLILSKENKEKLIKKLMCFWIKNLSFFHPWIDKNFLGLEWNKGNETYSGRILSKNSPNVIKTMKEFPNINNVNIIYKSGLIIECLISTKNWITVIEPIEPNYAAFAIDEKSFKKYITIDSKIIKIYFKKIPYERIIHNNNGNLFLNDFL